MFNLFLFSCPILRITFDSFALCIFLNFNFVYCLFISLLFRAFLTLAFIILGQHTGFNIY